MILWRFSIDAGYYITSNAPLRSLLTVNMKKRGAGGTQIGRDKNRDTAYFAAMPQV